MFKVMSYFTTEELFKIELDFLCRSGILLGNHFETCRKKLEPRIQTRIVRMNNIRYTVSAGIKENRLNFEIEDGIIKDYYPDYDNIGIEGGDEDESVVW